MKQTLAKTDRLKLRTEFDHVRHCGKKQIGSDLVAVWAPALDQRLRCGVICSRKFSLLSVKRNRARRLLWESFRLLKPHLPPGWLVLIPRRGILKRRRQEVELELAGLLAKVTTVPEVVVQSPPEC